MSEDLIAKLRAVKVPTKEEALARGGLVLDEACAPTVWYATQDEWVTYWRGVSGKTLASMPDYYSWFKELKELQKYDPEWVTKLLTTFRQEIGNTTSGNWLVTSTRVTYLTSGMDADIVHYYGNRKLESTYFVDRVEKSHGHAIWSAFPSYSTYFRTLLGTEDSADQIIKTLEFASGVSPDNIVFRTVVDRNIPFDELIHRVATLDFREDGRFVINTTAFISSDGDSRGVRYDK